MDAWISLLIQVPLVGAFIWYSLESQKKFSESLEKRDLAFQARNTAVIDTINSLNQSIATQLRYIDASIREHDAKVDGHFDRHESKTDAKIERAVNGAVSALKPAQARKRVE